MALNISEQELTRRRAAFNAFFFGMVSKDTPEQEYAEMLFALDVHRIIEKRKPANDAERAILRAYEFVDEVRNRGTGAYIDFCQDREKGIRTEPVNLSGEEGRAELSRRRDAYPVPPEIRAWWEDTTQAQHAFIVAVLNYYERAGKLPERFRSTAPSPTDGTPPTSGAQTKAKGRASAILRAPSLSHVGNMPFASNNVNGLAVQSFARFPEWEGDPANGYVHSFYQEKTDSKGNKITALFGVRGGPSAANMGELLAKGGPATVKAWYALWARWCEVGASPTNSVTVQLNDFCDNLGYRKHQKGGHRLENKQEAVRILDAITAVEMLVTLPHTDPKKHKAGKVLRLQGRLWERGLIVEEADYKDLFGAAQVGSPNLWEPVAFRYRPGEWFSDADFRSRHKRIGQIGAGLLRLQNDKDQWAILTGGYLGWQGDANQHAPKRIRAETILQAVGLAQSADAKRRAGETRTKFERALDRLVEVGVIAGWTWPDVDASEPDDFDDFTNYGPDTSAVWPGGEWRRKMLLVTWPDTLAERGELRQVKQQQHIKTAQARSARLSSRNAAKQSGEASGQPEKT